MKESSDLKAIIIDFGGVLLEWDPRNLYRHRFNTAEEMERFLSEISFNKWNSEFDKGRPFSEGIAELSRKFPRYEKLIQLFHTHWDECVGKPISGTIDLMQQLKLSGWPIYGLSNWSNETFPNVRKKFSFFNMLDDYLISGQVNCIKPDPAIFKILLRKIGIPAENCLFIDDTLVNINTANRLGLTCVHYISSEQLAHELMRLKII